MYELLEWHQSMLHSSRGLGRSPLKAKTGVRIPYGANKKHRTMMRCFLFLGCFIEIFEQP